MYLQCDGHALCDLTITVFLTTFPEAGVEVSEGKLVFPGLPNVVHCIGQLPLSDPGQLLSPGWRQCAVEGVLSWTLCVTTEEDNTEKGICCSFYFPACCISVNALLPHKYQVCQKVYTPKRQQGNQITNNYFACRYVWIRRPGSSMG